MSSNDAANRPVGRGNREIHTGDIHIEQKPVIESREDLVDEVVQAPPEVLQKEYADALAFAEEPVTILIQPSGEKNAARTVDIWVNGKGAEVLVDRRWIETSILPVGMPVTTKRKYVEVLARAKRDSVQTNVTDEESENPVNKIFRNTTAVSPFSIIRDNNPKGAAWIAQLVRFG